MVGRQADQAEGELVGVGDVEARASGETVAVQSPSCAAVAHTPQLSWPDSAATTPEVSRPGVG